MNWSGRDLRSWVERAEQRAVQRAVIEGGPAHFQLQTGDFERELITALGDVTATDAIRATDSTK